MLEINPKIFKAYDIRGVYGEDFDNDLAYRLAKSFVELRKADGDVNPNRKMRIAVAFDMRLSSESLKESLVRGLIESGADVFDLGLIATPTFYFAVGHYGYDGGIMISASHNPKEWNGFKLVRSKSFPISLETGINFLRDKVLENRFIPAQVPGEIYKNNKALGDCLRNALSFVSDNKIKKIKIVTDTANAMGGVYLKPLLESLQLPCTYINLELDGSFPAHEADPLQEKNLEQLKVAVRKEGADLGIASDGDGDRLFFIDNEGEIVNPAILRGLLAKIFLDDKPGSKIGYDVRPGKITRDLIVENGGVPVITKVGHSLIKEQMIKENIYFAGESSGHFYLNSSDGCFEYPEVMVIKLLLLLSKSEKTLSEIIKPYNKYFHSGEINTSVEDKEAVFQRIKDNYKDGEILLLDGVSVNYKDFWFNVRGSNTEEKIRLNLEAINNNLLEEKTKEVLALIF